MAQTQSHQLPPRTFSPPVSSPSPGTQSPVTGIAPPPKRQRLSPLPQSQSPYPSPNYGSMQIPTAGSPVNGVSVNGMSKPISNVPPPPPGSMGPPSRPVDKATDAAELTDVLASSGIDVKEEEAFLTSGYGRPPAVQPPQQPPRLQTNFSSSFESQPSARSTISANNSFSEQQVPKQPAISTPSYAPTSTVPVKTEETERDDKLREDTAASRREQYHLQSAFLHTALLEKRLEKRTVEHGVRLPMSGVFRPLPGRPTAPVEITGPDGSSVVRRDKTIITQDSTLGDIISLISLASEERLRSVVDHSAALAKSRRINSHGLIPPEWVELAAEPETSREDAANTSVGGGPANKTVPNGNNSTSGNTLDKDPNSNIPKTNVVPHTLAIKSRRLIDKDESFEEARAAKRAKRNADAILSGDGRAGSATPGTSTPTGQSSERAPDSEKKGSKKDSKKLESKVTTTAQHQQSVETARMSMNNLSSSRFGKKGGYSWLQSARPAASRSGFSTPTRTNTAAASSTANGNGKAKGAVKGNKRPGKRFGNWREDDKDGAANIQIRDILFMLEVDGRGMKHLQKAYSKDPKEDSEKSSR